MIAMCCPMQKLEVSESVWERDNNMHMMSEIMCV